LEVRIFGDLFHLGHQLLARAIAQRPRLLLLDEPFNGVDAVSQQALLQALATLQAQGAAVVVVEKERRE